MRKKARPHESPADLRVVFPGRLLADDLSFALEDDHPAPNKINFRTFFQKLELAFQPARKADVITIHARDKWPASEINSLIQPGSQAEIAGSVRDPTHARIAYALRCGLCVVGGTVV
jgi:hypothetical protein